MRTVIFPKMTESDKEVNLSELPDHHPIFVYQEDMLVGMVIEDPKKGWMISLGGRSGATGYHKNKTRCLQSCGDIYTFLASEGVF